jgi:EmrB/QacA subfamily drug resistance transporter
MVEDPDRRPASGRIGKWLPLLAVCLGTFMLLIDVTIVNVALPNMVGDLDTSFSALQWVLDAYAVALAALVLGAGSLGDIIGRRTTYIGGLAVFAGSSLICGLAPNAPVLIAARTVQGVGAAAMFATTVALLTNAYSGRDRGTAFGLWGATAGASGAIGPIIGGLLTELVSWRWIFFVNLPVSVAAIALCLVVLRDDPPEHRRRIDLAGMTTFAAAAGLLTYAMIRANDHGWASGSTAALVACSMVGLVAFVIVQARSPHAMFDLGLLRNRSFVGVLVASLAVSLASFSALTYTSIWLQSVLGLSPIESGLTGLPLSLAIFATSAALGRRLHGVHPGRVIGAGLLSIGFGGLLGLAFVRGDASWPSLVPGYLFIGIGAGLAIPASNATAMDAVPLQRAGMAGGSVRAVQQLGYAFGIALLGTVFAARAHQVLSGRGIPGAAATAHAVAGGQSPLLLQSAPADTRAALSQALHAAAVSGLQATLGLSGVVGLIAGCAVLVLIRRPAPVPDTSAQAPQAPTAPPAAVGQSAAAGQRAAVGPPLGAGQPALIGQVSDETGTPLAGAVLVLLDPVGVVVARLATAGDGGFLLPAAPGEYVLAAWAQGHQPRALSVDVGGRHELSLLLRRAAVPVIARPGARVPVSRPADR